MKETRKIGNLFVGDYTIERLVVHQSRAINARPEKIWETVSNHHVFSSWMPMVSSVEVNDTLSDSEGRGCERICTFGSDKIMEKVVHVEKSKVLGYCAENTSMFENHLAVIEISWNGIYSTVNYYVFFRPLGMKGFMMKHVMLPMVLKKALKNLKRISLINK